nr:putative copia-type protein [Tanacetum cinerariifolium]
MDANVPDEIDGAKGEQVLNHVVKKGPSVQVKCRTLLLNLVGNVKLIERIKGPMLHGLLPPSPSIYVRQCPGFPPRGSTQIMCDNKAAIQISENPLQHDRTKHVEVDRHFIKEKPEAGIIELPFVKSSDQLADILTRAVGTDMFHKCLSKLNFENPTFQLERECWKRK